MLYVESDNALGSTAGDVDDAFALAGFFAGGRVPGALASIFGNTAEAKASANNMHLAAICGSQTRFLRGAVRSGDGNSEAARFLAEEPDIETLVALGPLTNVAAALNRGGLRRVREAVVVGANATSRGRFPPLWPFEFNLTQDRRATSTVFESGLPLTIVPLDVARGMRVSWEDLQALQGRLGALLRDQSRRWLRRQLILKGARSFACFDLLAAMVVLRPSLLSFDSLPARAHSNGWIEFGRGVRIVRVVKGFDPLKIWNELVNLINKS